MSFHSQIHAPIPQAGAQPAPVVDLAEDINERHYDTIFYLIRQTTGARKVQIHLDGRPRPYIDPALAMLEAPLVHMGRRFGMLRAYAEQFESGAAHLLAGFAVLVAEQHALWSEAHLDVLTKAMTRRAFKMELGRAVSIYQRSGVACSLIMFDLDHFKKINDTHGHAAGDAVLSAVAHVVQSELRSCDRLGRLGGEEFGVLVLADAEASLEIAERLRATIEGTTVRDFPNVEFTASLGVAAMDEKIPSPDALMSLADARLYAAKLEGRNRVNATAELPEQKAAE
ncbi:MAG: GGDEF domain-containing protein [Roseinatronobacter sp.]